MPSPRRMRLVLLAAIVTLFLILFYSSRPSQGSQPAQDFSRKTLSRIKKDSPPGQAVIDTETGRKAGLIPADKDGDGDVDEDDKKAAAAMQVRLKEAEQKAKSNANVKGGLKPDSPRNVVGKGSSAGGQPRKDTAEAAAEAKDAEEQPDADADAELSTMLKKAPVVIFSKTYCPYSKRAKGVLLDKYTITPEPFIVELDQHPLGASLQAALAHMTGRKTVPNVLVNGVSIGGGDDIVDLDNQNKLARKIQMLGNKRVQVSERFTSAGKDV
ncbi:uncharacterized protein UV8b_02414 [Ustilaginoidea virens]|uniref:Glutaredoxin domain-containing protein n=2 Tax=Ustilaginoidea virens TaxID=1159556 RepID=A0A8E5HMT6_USTVR|nr:uncharacterized protein UV8b_02414 [Ustilaginoidea virens]QUC18173.1 hypothetical protein UV8b_02414 [Ustilaginoidea virens]